MIKNYLIRGIVLLSLFISQSYASFILENDNILHDKAISKMQEIATELKEKTDISLYVIAKDSLNGKKIKEYEKEASQKLEGSFVLITFAKQEQKIDIFNSVDLNSKFDRDEVLSEFIIPIFVSKGKDINKFGAGIFNGYAEVADQISKSYNIELKSSIGSEGKETYDIIMIVIWFMLLSFIGTYLYIYFYRK